jgi:hypothetical protein
MSYYQKKAIELLYQINPDNINSYDRDFVLRRLGLLIALE